jgi:hypothetical protein
MFQVRKLKKAMSSFWYEASSAQALACFRIGISVALLCQLTQIAPHISDLYGQFGLQQEKLSAYLGTPWLPRIAWVTEFLESFGLNYGWSLYLIFGTYAAALVFLALGFITRPASVVVWILQFTILNSNNISNYGVDQFNHVFLSYFCVMPVAATWSLDSLFRKRPFDPRWLSISLRILQIHLCIVYFVAGQGKAMGLEWWNGESMWRALMLPEYYHFNFAWMASWPLIPTVIGIGTILIEMLYPIFIWPRITRLPWALAILSMHFGIIVLQGLHFFGAVMMILTFSGFVVPYLANRKTTGGKHLLCCTPSNFLSTPSIGS